MAKSKSTLLHKFVVTMTDDMANPVGHAANAEALQTVVPDNVVDIKYVNTTVRKVAAEA